LERLLQRQIEADLDEAAYNLRRSGNRVHTSSDVPSK
jgi:hypothetical protein